MFSPPRVFPQVRSIILRIVDGRSLVVKVHIEVVLSLPHVVLHGDALVHSHTALSLLFRLTHCPQIRTGHSLAWHFTQFHNQQPHHLTHDPTKITRAQADTSAHLSDRNAHSDWSSDAPTVWNVPRLLHWAQIPKHEQFTGANLRWHKYVHCTIKTHYWTTQWSKCAALKSHLSGEVFDVCISWRSTKLRIQSSCSTMLSITTDRLEISQKIYTTQFFTLKTHKLRLFLPEINSKNASLSAIWPSFG